MAAQYVKIIILILLLTKKGLPLPQMTTSDLDNSGKNVKNHAKCCGARN